MSIYYRREQKREMLFVKSLHLKVAREKLQRILPSGYDYDTFLDAFKQYFPCEWEDIIDYCKSKKQDCCRRSQNGLRTVRFYTPDQFLKKHVNLKCLNKSSFSDNEILRIKEELQRKAEKKKEKREKRMKDNLVTVQEVCPSYVKQLIKLYFSIRRKNTLNINVRYLLLLEASQFKCDETISFLQKVNACDKNDDLRKIAFKSLQRIGVQTWLARKRKGRKRLSQIKPIDIKENPTELLHFIYEYQHLLHQEYDVFLSHSSLDSKILLEIKAAINSQGLTVYIDWVNDYVMLNRKNQNENTWDVLEMRMRQSKQMVYVMTDHSVQSPYTEREVNYFKKQGKSVLVYKPYATFIQRPDYLSECEDCQFIKIGS